MLLPLFSVLLSHLVLHSLSAAAAVVTAAVVEAAFTEVGAAFMAVPGRTVEVDIMAARGPIVAVRVPRAVASKAAPAEAVTRAAAAHPKLVAA